MPLYEYECLNCKGEDGKPCRFELRRAIADREKPAHCGGCGALMPLCISLTHWKMGWKHLKNKAEKSPPAPTDSGYHPEWDQAYAP